MKVPLRDWLFYCNIFFEPLVIRVPWLSHSHGRVVTEIVEQIDILPTLVTMALGSKFIPTCAQGKDLSSLFKHHHHHKSQHDSSSPQYWALTQHPRCFMNGTFSQGNRTNPWSDPCGQRPSNSFTLMGYSLRTSQWRYTEWRNWNNITLSVDWSKAGLQGMELYSHGGEPSKMLRFDYHLEEAFENRNVAYQNDKKEFVRELSKSLQNIVLNINTNKQLLHKNHNTNNTNDGECF
jgi:hypothetical protein